jgi:two-component system, OmpR family, response regulator
MTADVTRPLASSSPALPHRQAAARASTQRWTEATGAHLLVIDPDADIQVADDMSARGVHVTAVSSTIDGLILFGRTNPQAIVLATRAPGVSATDFIATVLEYSSPFVIAALDSADEPDAGALLIVGASAAVTRPYTAATLWEVLQRSTHALDHHAQVSFGPIELDARAYTVHIHGQRIADLPLKEFELLRVLMTRAPGVVDNDELRSFLWGGDGNGPTDNTIAVHVARLRNRLQGIALIRRVRSRGYALSLG